MLRLDGAQRRVVHVHRRDVRHQEPLRGLGIDRPIGRRAIVDRQEAQRLVVGLFQIHWLNNGRLHGGVNKELEIQILEARRNGQLVGRLPVELAEQLVVVPAGILVVLGVKGRLAGTVVGFARRDGLRNTIAARRRGIGRERAGLDHTVVRRDVVGDPGAGSRQGDLEGEALGAGIFVQAADLQGADAEVLGEQGGVADHPIFVALQIAGQSGHLVGGIARAAGRIGQARDIGDDRRTTDGTQRLGIVVGVGRLGLVGIPIAVGRIVELDIRSEVAGFLDVFEIRLLLGVVVVLVAGVERIVAEGEILLARLFDFRDRPVVDVGLVIVVVIAGVERRHRQVIVHRQRDFQVLVVAARGAVGQVAVGLVFLEVGQDVRAVQALDRPGRQGGDRLDGVPAAEGDLLADAKVILQREGEQVQRTAEAGLADIGRPAGAAVDDHAADGGVREERVGVVRRAVGVAPGNAVIGDVELTVGHAPQRELGAVRGARAVRIAGADHRDGQRARGRIVADHRRVLFDERAVDHRLRFKSLQ